VDEDCLVEILTVTEAAIAWGMREDALRRACQRGTFTAEEARKSGQTWLLTRQAMEREYGTPRADAGGGVPVADLLATYGLRKAADVLARRDAFAAGELWREGRRWYTTEAAMARVFGGR